VTDISADEVDSLRYEIRELRAEVERLKADNTQATTAYVLATNRAQHYEAEVERLRQQPLPWNIALECDQLRAEVERLNAKIAYVRQRSQRACEILNEFDATERKP
jgi:outer membrane murein-binding lipoprotein Lpp